MRKKIVVFTGAGISAESGIATFRDSNGLWEQYRIEDVATPEAWKKNPALVLSFYNMRRKKILEAIPNDAHKLLATLQKKYDVTIITQNIDDLHERAGSKNVLHLHGEILKMRSEKNEHLIYEILSDIQIGDKAKDGAQLRPHIVWFGEAVPMMEQAVEIVKEADIFVVIGSSLQVYPGASLLYYVPPHVQIVVIDTFIPTLQIERYIPICAKATIGVKQWIEEYL